MPRPFSALALEIARRLVNSSGMEHDRIYQIALERLAANLEERRELEAFIATYQKLARPSEPVSIAPIDEGFKGAGKTADIVLAAMSVLADNRAPMRLGEIYKALVERGVEIGGKIPRNNLGAKLSADDRLVTHKHYGWWFKGEPIPVGILESVEPEYVEIDDQKREDPGTEFARSSQSNGAAVSAA